MNLQPTLQDGLIRIRPLKESDQELLYQVAKDPKIWEQHPCKRYLRDEFEKFFFESMESKGALVVIDQATDKVIGSSRFKKFDAFPNMVEIGWSFLDRIFWGGKYNKTVKGLMIEHAFHFVDQVVFYIDQNNIRSQRAVEKIGGQMIIGLGLEHLPKTSSGNFTFVINK